MNCFSYGDLYYFEKHQWTVPITPYYYAGLDGDICGLADGHHQVDCYSSSTPASCMNAPFAMDVKIM